MNKKIKNLLNNRIFIKTLVFLSKISLAYLGWMITSVTIVESWVNNLGLLFIIIAVLSDNIYAIINFINKN